MMSKPLKILFTSAEVVPFAKTGGLADVAGALPKALEELGHDVRVAMPRYGRIDIEKFQLQKAIEHLKVPMNHFAETVSIYEGKLGKNVPVYMVDSPNYFNREGIYGYQDDGERFVLFCRATIEMLKTLNWQPDIIHCNDWHTAIIPNWMATIYKDDPFFANTATVYTIHNLAYQGVFGYRILEIAGIDEHGFVYPQISELANVVDLMGRGILFADVVNTVSETYAKEIRTAEYGEKLDPLLRDRADSLFGIVNGVDYEEQNPATDKFIAKNYDLDSLDAKLENKLALQKESNLPQDPDVPLIGMISRLTNQKGFDILGQCVDHLLDLHSVQFVLLGTGDQHYHEMFGNLVRQYPQQAAVFLTFNAALAQKIYAGSDMFLMPSKFEPCGLGQLIAMRYGSVPIVRATGGLADTVEDVNPARGYGTGFAFKPYDRWALFSAIVRALETYKYKSIWRQIQERGIKADFGWATSARKYVGAYERALEIRKGRVGELSAPA
ncbi:MAG: glycogen synthase [Chloroflexi bacterium]|nr:glycogen synthase [Chloroflexota bacterium]